MEPPERPQDAFAPVGLPVGHSRAALSAWASLLSLPASLFQGGFGCWSILRRRAVTGLAFG